MIEDAATFGAFVSSLSGQAAFWLLLTVLFVVTGGVGLIAWMSFKRLEEKLEENEEHCAELIESKFNTVKSELHNMADKLDESIKSSKEHNRVLHEKTDKNMIEIASIKGRLGSPDSCLTK